LSRVSRPPSSVVRHRGRSKALDASKPERLPKGGLASPNADPQVLPSPRNPDNIRRNMNEALIKYRAGKPQGRPRVPGLGLRACRRGRGDEPWPHREQSARAPARRALMGLGAGANRHPPRSPRPKEQRDVAGRNYLTKAEINALSFATHSVARVSVHGSEVTCVHISHLLPLIARMHLRPRFNRFLLTLRSIVYKIQS